MNKAQDPRGSIVAALVVTIISLTVTGFSAFALYDLIASDRAASWVEGVVLAIFVLGGVAATWCAALWTRQEATR